jgi:hydroxypyruvate reductase
MKKRILQKDDLWLPLACALAERYDIGHLWRAPDPAAYLEEHGAEFVALVSSSRTGASAALMDALPNVRAISNYGVGLDLLDLAHAKARGIAVGYTPDVLTDCVADLAFGLMIDAARGMSKADRFVRGGAWPGGSIPLAWRVSGKRLGIVGLGRIGQAVAQRAGGFAMEIGYCDLRQRDDVPHRFFDSVPALAQWADFLVVAASGGPETRSVIDAEVLAALGRDGFLVNISRGSNVDEGALLQALETRTVAGAGLDVHRAEPQVDPRFFALDNVVLLPHIASNTRETRQAMADRVIENLESFFAAGAMVATAA